TDLCGDWANGHRRQRRRDRLITPSAYCHGGGDARDDSMSTGTFPFEPGAAVSTLVLPAVTRLDLIKYAGASGDFNPIHTIDESAAAAGLPGVIQHGMLTAAKLCRLFSPYVAEGFVSLIDLRFTAMVVVGDVLTIVGTVTEARKNEA